MSSSSGFETDPDFDKYTIMSRAPRLSIVVTQDRMGNQHIEIEDEDTGVKEYLDVGVDTYAVDNAIAPDSIAGIPLFAPDEVSSLTDDTSSLPVAPPPPPISNVGGRSVIYPPIDIKALINIQDDDDELPPPPPPRMIGGPLTPTSAGIVNHLQRMSINAPAMALPSIPEAMNAGSAPHVCAPFAEKPHPVPPKELSSSQSLPKVVNVPPIAPISAPSSATPTPKHTPPPLPPAAPMAPAAPAPPTAPVVPAVPPPALPVAPMPPTAPPAPMAPRVSVAPRIPPRVSIAPNLPPPPLPPTTPSTLPPSLPNARPPAIATRGPAPPPVPSVISPASFFRPQQESQGEPIVVTEEMVDIPTRFHAFSLSVYPVVTNKPKADLTSVGDLQVHSTEAANTPIVGVKRTAHVKLNASTGALEGLPSEWQSQLNKAFGLPLQLCATEVVPGYTARVPPVLVLMKKYLVQHGGLSTRGIFRLAPEGNEAAQVKAQLNDGTFTGCSDVNVIANLLKVWFRDMPGRLLDVVRDSKLITECETAAQAGEVVMTRFRDPHQSLLLWLLDLCADVSERADVNMMTPQNMAIVFAPNLFKLADSGANAGMDPVKLMSLCKKYTIFVEKAIEWRLQCPDRPKLDL